MPKLSTGQITLCGIELTEKDLYDSMKTWKMINLWETMV